MNCFRASGYPNIPGAVLRRFSLFLTFLTVFSLSQQVFANVYATNFRFQNTTNDVYIAQGAPLAVTYILNEPASAGVTLEMISGTNVVRTIEIPAGSGGTLRGLNTVFWDGTDDSSQLVERGYYTARITAKSDGYSDWTQLTDDANPGNFVWEPRAIAVNCNSNSPFYGRVFVGNSHANPSRSTEPGDKVGVLKLNADGSPVDEGEYSDGGYPWAGDFFSPWKIEVSDDDKVYINDWTTNGVVIAFDQLISTNWQIILSTNNWPPVGTNAIDGATNYANLSGPFITGTGTNTQIWMADISFNQDTNVATGVGVRRWNVGTNGSVAPDDLGTTIIQAEFGSDLNLYPYDLSIDKNGRIYVIQYRANPSDTANKAFRFPQYDELGTPERVADWKVGGPNYLVGAFGVSVNRSGTLVAVALREGGAVVVLDAETGTNVTTIPVALGHDRRDVTWDNVGNLYSVDNFDSLWRAFSPPGTNQSTTVMLQSARVIQGPALSSPTISGDQFQFLLSGETNFNYVIEQSSDLLAWTPSSTNLLTNGVQPISVPMDPVQQFYRAVLAP